MPHETPGSIQIIFPSILPSWLNSSPESESEWESNKAVTCDQLYEEKLSWMESSPAFVRLILLCFGVKIEKKLHMYTLVYASYPIPYYTPSQGPLPLYHTPSALSMPLPKKFRANLVCLYAELNKFP